MPDSPLYWTALCGAAFIAGVVNSVAGGGTILTFPTLLAVLSPVPANATNTFALLPGTIASSWGYRAELVRARPHLIRLLPPSVIGGVFGSILLTRLPETIFARLVPWLLISASSLMLLQKPLARWVGSHPSAQPTKSTVAVIVFFQFLIAIYGGYFGAGIGILMLSSLAFMGIPDLFEMNGVKTILSSAINGV